MRTSHTAGLLALAASANALSNSSPFVLLSTAKFAQTPDAAQLQTGTQVLSAVQNILDSCPTENYYVISQPNANAADIRGEGCKVPSVCSAISSDKVSSRYGVAEVLGEVEVAAVTGYINSGCAKQSRTPKIWNTLLPGLSSSGRDSQLADNDQLIKITLDEVLKLEDFTVIYLASPSEQTSYEAEFNEPLHEDLKRLRARVVSAPRADNNTEWEKLGLFDKYQFFTPGIFHALVISILLLSILGVGLRALGSLEVSYGAFDKENGPAAHKKQN
ncbi:hypothetical protein VDGE_01419 [Verticillium dahliae]|uniref:Protein BIG1 n=1 Tax=Verticillium dahliae TaxID=27337 RepID=A0A444RV79_VERDA|nr:hypothetical protein VDGE_01419 [Verticillium dahliae]